MGSMIWKWDQGVIDDLSCLFLLTALSVPPGIDWLLVLAAALIYISPLYILLFSSFNPCLQLDKRGNWLFFLAERETTHKRAVAAFLLTFNHPDEKSNFPVNFCEEQSRDNITVRLRRLLPDFIREFYWGVYGQTRCDCEREWYTTKLLLSWNIR